jgi:hypothetical protein
VVNDTDLTRETEVGSGDAPAGGPRRRSIVAIAIDAAGPPWETVSEQVASSVHAADLDALDGTIPQGCRPTSCDR